jgi:hypothetical protein
LERRVQEAQEVLLLVSVLLAMLEEVQVLVQFLLQMAQGLESLNRPMQPQEAQEAQ